MQENDKQNSKEEKNLLDDILANALSSTKKYEETNAGLETKRCKSCGAARPEDTDLKYCDFCGDQFY
ncbi:hypothetical protein IWQ47_000650 [Aquimarina sp. EL_43]|uniref:hypothetical protein n=1 Tax=unclassified Aquimarina TaxID=2627091 RepID=UPI0018CBE98F|nr:MULTISPECIES: hypothetical protein [unclassified Aquimarina]MBG6128660.1 hypothetical protein [Aquimarina sp. EL_35]MBG6149723.1 hypothetical protein [Aquimarina sp. EL_32]MBG6167592.1 hypothetical protein [Aquimarina sp. EL_43]